MAQTADVAPVATERVALTSALQRVLAEEVVADRDQPPFDRSTRDGYAVRAEEFAASRSAKVVGFLPAGASWTGGVLGTGGAVEIMTGAPVPAGADAVVMLEHVARDGDVIVLSEGRGLKAGENVVLAGAEAKQGQVLLAAGVRLTAAEIGLAASVGAALLPVRRKPSVAILATGDELVGLEETPAAHQIRNSNSYTLAALVEESGGVACVLPVAADTVASLRERIGEARKHDLILLSGGVSAGKHDLVETVLAEMGAEFLITAVAMQPGKPAVFGKLHDGPYFFGLPGNPVSTQVTFLLFAAPMLRALSGAADVRPMFVQAKVAESMRHKVGLTRFLPARLEASMQPTVKLTPWQGSGDLTANARANCYAVLPPDRELIEAGDAVTVLLR